MKRVNKTWWSITLRLVLALTLARAVPVYAEDSGIIINPGHMVGSVSIAGYQITSIKVSANDTQGEYSATTTEVDLAGADSIGYELVVEADLDYHVVFEATVLANNYTKAILPVAGPVTVSKYFNPEDAYIMDMTFEPAIISGTVSTPNDSGSNIEAINVIATTYVDEVAQAFSSSTSGSDLNVPGIPGADYTLLVVPGLHYSWHATARIDGADYSSDTESVTAPAAGSILDKDYVIEDTTDAVNSIISGTSKLLGIDVYSAAVSGMATEPPARSDSDNLEDFTTGLYSLDEVDSDTWQLKARYSYYLPGDLSHLTGKLTTGYTLVTAEEDRTAVDFIIDPAFIPGSISLSGPTENFTWAFMLGDSATDKASGSSRIDPATGRFVHVCTPGEWRYADKISMSFDYQDDHYLSLSSGITVNNVSAETKIVTAGQTTDNVGLAFETSVIKYYFTVDGQGTLSSPYIRVKSADGYSSATGNGSVSSTNSGMAMVTLLEPGEYEIEAFATVDGTRMSFGTVTTYVDPGVVVVAGNTEGPTVQVTSPADMDVVCGESITINGIATDDVAVASIMINGTNVAFASTNNPEDANEVSFSYEADLPVIGNNIFDVVVTDEDEQEPATTSLTVIRDEYCYTDGPSVQVTSPTNNDVVCDKAITVEGFATDDVGIDAVTINGTSVAFTSTNNPEDASEVYFSYETTLPLIGDNIFDVIVTDIDGQEPATLSLNVIRETCAPQVIEWPVDIKPTSCPNPVNVKSKGVLPVAILGSTELDVYSIDPNSVRIFGVAPIRASYEDVSQPYYPFIGKQDQLDCHPLSGDGFIDLTLKFDRRDIVDAIRHHFPEELVQNGQALILPLEAYMYDKFGGNEIIGEDVIVIRGASNKSGRGNK